MLRSPVLPWRHRPHQEVGRLATVELDDVHRGHRETGSVHQAGDVSVETDVIEAMLRRFDFARVFFGDVTHRRDVWMAIKRVVIEVKLRIERQHVAMAVTTSGFTSTIEQSYATNVR